MSHFDVFICHASEDKQAVVEPLAKELEKRGRKVWLDKYVLRIGDSLWKKINEGLSKSKYGIVVVSPSFLQKDWPQKELDGLVQKEIDGVKVILPVWHNVEREDIVKYAPILADKLAGKTDKGIDKLAEELILAMNEKGEDSNDPEKKIKLAGDDSKMIQEEQSKTKNGDIEPEAPPILRYVKWLSLYGKKNIIIILFAALLVSIFFLLPKIDLKDWGWQTKKSPNNILPDRSRAIKKTEIYSLEQFRETRGLFNNGDYFKLSSPPSPDAEACAYTKDSFSTHYVASVHIAGQHGASKLELQGGDVWFAVGAFDDSYFLYESGTREQNWTGHRPLKIEKEGGFNTLIIYQNGPTVRAFLNDRYVRELTKWNEAKSGPISVCFKFDSQTGGSILFQKLTVEEF